MKASAYQTDIATGRLMTLDCFMMIGEYADEAYLTDEYAQKAIAHERQRVIEQADFVGQHIVKFLQRMAAPAQGAA